MNLERRITTLERSVPKHDPLSVLSDEELKTEMFKTCQRLHAAGLPIDKRTLVGVPECRQFSDEPVWAQDRTHRLDVFLKFKRVVFEHNMPNQSRIISILNQGWSDQKISINDKDWLLSAFDGIDLGEEGPWLKEYLDYSGSKEI
jgi:hypothetical protein